MSAVVEMSGLVYCQCEHCQHEQTVASGTGGACAVAAAAADTALLHHCLTLSKSLHSTTLKWL